MGAWEDGFAAGWKAAKYPFEVPESATPVLREIGTRRKPKRKGTPDPKMARALKKANAMGRKKSGGFKKGWSQGKIMSKAHQLKRRM